MADQRNSSRRTPLDTRELLVAITVAFATWIGFMLFFDWGMLPAVIGGFSMGVIWWSVNRAFRRSS
ncbi:MAG: hypothetical protein ACH36H_11815 [Candidatus Nanopelagicales bacterium]